MLYLPEIFFDLHEQPPEVTSVVFIDLYFLLSEKVHEPAEDCIVVLKAEIEVTNFGFKSDESFYVLVYLLCYRIAGINSCDNGDRVNHGLK